MSKRIVEQGTAFTAKQKDTIPKVDIDVAMSREQVELYLEIFCSATLQIVSTDPASKFEGLDSEQGISASGFSEDGRPIIDQYDPSIICDYEFRGSKTGQAYIGGLYIRGLHAGKETIKGWRALSVKLGVSEEKIRTEIEALVNNGAKRIYIRYVHNLVGLTQSYGLFQDDIIFSTQPWDRKAIDYNSIINKKLCVNLKTKWRIRTPEMVAVLTKKRTEALENTYGNE